VPKKPVISIVDDVGLVPEVTRDLLKAMGFIVTASERVDAFLRSTTRYAHFDRERALQAKDKCAVSTVAFWGAYPKEEAYNAVER
jgi:hypothetical protein